MLIELRIPESLVDGLDAYTTRNFAGFLQAVLNRRVVGGLRYGDRPQRRQKYLTRLKKELRAYAANGNFEQLLNIAVYCFLESETPENKKFHFDATVESVTREETEL
jgi:hypothetical protein